MEVPLAERHARLTTVLRASKPPIHLCPSTSDAATARRWFVEFEGAGLDGIVAKRLDGPYTPDKRTMVKVKHVRTADCAVAGYRIHKDGKGVGSLLLGLFDDDGKLHHVGVAASFTAKRRAELLDELAPLLENALVDHPWQDWAEAQAHVEQRMPGNWSRWNVGKDLSFVPIRVERVAEVTFGQLSGGRFRHGVSFLRWRPDRTPESCRYEQLDVAAPRSFLDVVGSTEV
jgi:ATP-dependent DNA ligase